MKWGNNDDMSFDFDQLGARAQDLLHRFAPFADFSKESLASYDDFALRSLLRRMTARRDTLADAIDMIKAEQGRRKQAPEYTVPEKI